MADPTTVTDLTKGVYRRLYSGFTKGQRINKLSLQAEAWFWRVMATADDFGNADAEPGLCLAATVGRRVGITPSQVAKWLDEMRESGLIRMYADESGDKYLHINGFEELQPSGKNGRRVRRFPACESEGIQGNPDVVSASYSYSYSDSDPHSDPDKADAPPFSGKAFLDALSDFEKHRKEIKKPLKETGRHELYRQLAEMGEGRSVAAMRKSIAAGWQGVFEPNGTGKLTNVDRALAAADRVAAKYERQD